MRAPEHESPQDLRALAAAIRFGLEDGTADAEEALTVEDVRGMRHQLESFDANLKGYVAAQQQMARYAGLVEFMGKDAYPTGTRALKQGFETDLQDAKKKLEDMSEEERPPPAVLRLYARLCEREAALLRDDD
jgi:hypothetical protein